MSKHHFSTRVPSPSQYKMAFQRLEEKGELRPQHKELLTVHYGRVAITEAELSSRVGHDRG